jgi:hypothetical protein
MSERKVGTGPDAEARMPRSEEEMKEEADVLRRDMESMEQDYWSQPQTQSNAKSKTASSRVHTTSHHFEGARKDSVPVLGANFFGGGFH